MKFDEFNWHIGNPSYFAIAATITMLIFIAWMIHDIIYPPESDGWY